MAHSKPQTRTTCRCFRIEKKAICFFKFIFEAYEGIAVVETLDANAGVIAVHIAPGCEEMVAGIIEDLKNSYLVEPHRQENDETIEKSIFSDVRLPDERI